jgi:AcrR family transcriptional regulator
MEKRITRKERERLLLISTVTQCAEELFRRNGYENTTVDALAAGSEYTKRTIYRYFAGKEDLYFAVMQKGHERLLETIRVRIQVGRTGFEKIKLAYNAFYGFFTENGWLFDMMSQIKTIKSRKNLKELPYFERYADCIRLLYREVMALYVLAQDDKSIRTDVDPMQLGYSSIFIMNGFFHMLNFSGDSFTQHFQLDKEQFIAFTVRLLFQVLEGRPQ